MKSKNSSPKEVKRYYIDIERYGRLTQARRLSRIFLARREKESATLVERYSNGGVILDLGCGSGLITRHLHGKLVIGLDINPWLVEKVKLRLPGVEFIVGDAESLPLKSGTFDTVICTEVLEHLPIPAEAMKEISRILKGGGLLIISVPSENPVFRFRKFLWYLKATSSALEPIHRSYSISRLKLLSRRFSIIRIVPMAFWLSLAVMLQKF